MSTRGEPAWKRAWRDFEQFRGSLIGFLAIEVLAAAVGGIIAVWWLASTTSSPTAQTLYGGIGVVVGLGVAFVGIYAFNLALAPYRQRNEARQEVIELQAQIDQLKAQPSLAIVFGVGEPFKERQEVPDWPREYVETLYRVGIEHTGTATVDRVAVELESIAPLPPTLLGIPLRLHVMNDIPLPGNAHREDFPLDAEQRQFIDVVFKRDDEGLPPSDEIVIFHIVPGISCSIPAGRYEIGLFAHGHNVKVARQTFVVDVDADGALQFALG